MNTEVDTTQEDPKMLKCQKLAERFYDRFRDEQLKLNLPFSGQPLANGLPPHVSAGNTLLPSLIEMEGLGHLISLALNYWAQYGQLPTVAQMRTSAESMESDSVGYITTLYSLVMLGALLTCVCAGNLDRAISALSGSMPEEERRTISQNTRQRMPVRIAPGPSTAEVTSPPPTSSPSENASAATISTSSNGRKPKKKARKSRRKRTLAKKKKR